VVNGFTCKILPIPTPLMAGFVKQMQERLRDKKIGYNKEFLREIIKEVRIRGKEVILTYKIPLTPKKTTGENPGKSSLQCHIWWSQRESNPCSRRERPVS
jgi:hypothetical protein